jgi:hypothetical protein
MVKTIAFTVLLTLITTGLFAQSRKKEPQGLQFGFKAGAAYSKIKARTFIKIIRSKTSIAGEQRLGYL